MKQRIETSLIHAGVRDGYANKKKVPSMCLCIYHRRFIRRVLMNLVNMIMLDQVTYKGCIGKSSYRT